MRKFIFGFLSFLIISLIFPNIQGHAATEIKSIHLEVFVHDDGSAKFVERRVMNIDEGTESFIIINNLGKSKIKHFKVTKDGNEFTSLENWNINATREEKAFKSGMIETENGYELSWGFGEYGSHEFVLEYVVTDFVKQLKDSQVIFWRFINDEMYPSPQQVVVEISSNHYFEEGPEEIWAYGFHGGVEFENGKIVARSTKPFTTSNFLTILTKLNKEQFTTNDKFNKTFKQIQKEANKGSSYLNKISLFFYSVGSFLIHNFVITIFLILCFLAYFLFPLLGIRVSWLNMSYRRKYPGEYYRDYPYEGNFIESYYIMRLIGLGNFDNLFTAILLGWIKDEKISVTTEPSGFFRRKSSVLIFLEDELDDNESPNIKRLFKSLRSAAKSSKSLNERQLSRWAERNKTGLKRWEKEVYNKSIVALRESDYLSTTKRNFLLFKRESHKFTSKGEELEVQTHKFVNYLHDFSLLNEHEAVNVHIWDELMIWAGFLGLTDVVMKQFKAIYPQYAEQSAFKSEHALIATRALARSTSDGRSASARRSSGGGGTASVGGGGGSFGGGSGGGVR